ncbi:hypothetical protein CFC21_058049, partial [Triticum aestivum]
PGRRRRRRR